MDCTYKRSIKILYTLIYTEKTAATRASIAYRKPYVEKFD
jgi:hypothetical protein